MTNEELDKLHAAQYDTVYTKILPLFNGLPYWQCIDILDKAKAALNVNAVCVIDKQKAEEYLANAKANI